MLQDMINEAVDAVAADLAAAQRIAALRARPRVAVREAKQDALDALDRLLGCSYSGDPDKVAALRHVAEAATRMAANIEQWARDREHRESGRAG